MATVRSRHRTKPCPFCAEPIRYEAIKCRFCGEFLRGDRVHSCPEPDGSDSAEEEALLEEDQEEELEDEYEYEEEEEEEDDVEDEDEEEYEEEDEEELLYVGRPSLFALTPLLLGTFVLILGCGALYFQPVTHLLLRLPKVQLTQEQLVRIENWLDLGALVAALLIGLYTLYKAALLKSIYYEVTPDRIEYSRGIFDRRVDNLDMYRIIDIKLRRTLWDCLVGMGTVHLTTKDESDPTFDFHKIRQSRHLYNVVKKAGLVADRVQNVVHLE